jgi:hypothetical protein
MKHTLFAAALLACGFSVPASAQWGGLGDNEWGWKRPVCHLCLSAVELTVVGGKGKTDDVAYRNDFDADGGDLKKISQDATHIKGDLRIGLGPRLFLDGSYRHIKADGDNDSFDVSRKFSQIRYGGGVFLLTEPSIGAVYVRVGGTQLKEKVDLKLKEAGAGQAGASGNYDADSLSGFGGAIGGFWNSGGVRLEASYGIYGDLQEGLLELSYAFNPRLHIVLAASLLDLDSRSDAGTHVGVTEDEARDYVYRPIDQETMVLYGAGLRLRF